MVSSSKLLVHGFICYPVLALIPRTFQNIIERPEKSLENENFIESKYYTIKESGSIFNQSASKKAFSNLHSEMRSLTKNLWMLNDTLGTFKKAQDIIAMPKTKLHDYPISNINV